MNPRTGVLPGLNVMVDRAEGWKFAWQQSPLAACPQEVKDGVEDGTKVGGARSPARSRRRQNRAQQKPTPRRSGRCRRIEYSSYGPFWPGSALFQDRRQLFKHPLSQDALERRAAFFYGSDDTAESWFCQNDAAADLATSVAV